MNCSVEGCEAKHYAKGWCRSHWRRMYQYGRLEKVIALVRGNCTIDGCDKKIKAHGLCKNHYHTLRTYGVHPKEYNEKLKIQNYVCAICEQPETTIHPLTKEVKKLSQDHCHATGKMRGLLCTRCNHFLGRVNESIELLEKMKQYLIKYKD